MESILNRTFRLVPSLIRTPLARTIYGSAIRSFEIVGRAKKQTLDAGLEFSYAEMGPKTAPRVTILHGIADEKASFYLLAKVLARDYRVVLVDLPGFGFSERPNIEHVSLPNYADWVIGFLDLLSDAPTHLIGHSFGANIAGLVANRWQKNTLSVTLICPTVILPDAEPLGFVNDMLDDENFMRIRNWQDFRSYLNMTSHRIPAFLKGPMTYRTFLKMQENSEWHEDVLASLLYFIESGSMDGAVPGSYLEEYKSIQVPLSIIWGRHDKLMPLEAGTKLHAELPHARYTVLDRVGHAPHLEAPLRLGIELKHFLDTVEIR